MAHEILERARGIQDQITAWRRDIHMHPELGFREFRTSKLVAETLQGMGIEVQTNVGKTGVVAYLGKGSPIVGIRADMDALPIQEANAVPYASQNAGVMHACGHDSHTAMLLGAATILNQMDSRPPGQIRLFFQPSEEGWDSEGKSGAARMIEEGALDGVDAVIALHVGSESPSGKVEIREGWASAAADSFEATIIGTGGHGAYPHQGIDPTFILAQVINTVHGIRARRVDPVHPAVISIGAIHAGDASNVIAREVKMNGTIRSYDDDIRQQLWRELEMAFGVSRALGGDYQLTIHKGFPSMYNDPVVAQTIRQVAHEMLGEDGLLPPKPPGMGAEDFAYMTRKAPGAMFELGARIGSDIRPHHTPVFDLDESAFPVGTAVLVETACRLLKMKADNG